MFHPKQMREAGLIQERNWMTKFLQAGFVDTFREQNPDKFTIPGELRMRALPSGCRLAH